FFLFFDAYAAHPDLHSFPTRRSSDLHDIEGNVFHQSEIDILHFFMNDPKIRNRKQLEYLSGNKQSKNHILRFTLYPNFGFLFFVDRKSTRLNSSHVKISYAVFCLKKK